MESNGWNRQTNTEVFVVGFFNLAYVVLIESLFSSTVKPILKEIHKAHQITDHRRHLLKLVNYW